MKNWKQNKIVGIASGIIALACLVLVAQFIMNRNKPTVEEKAFLDMVTAQTDQASQQGPATAAP